MTDPDGLRSTKPYGPALCRRRMTTRSFSAQTLKGTGIKRKDIRKATRERLFLGIDAGSTTTKAALIR